MNQVGNWINGKICSFDTGATRILNALYSTDPAKVLEVRNFLNSSKLSDAREKQSIVWNKQRAEWKAELFNSAAKYSDEFRLQALTVASVRHKVTLDNLSALCDDLQFPKYHHSKSFFDCDAFIERLRNAGSNVNAFLRYSALSLKVSKYIGKNDPAAVMETFRSITSHFKGCCQFTFAINHLNNIFRETPAHYAGDELAVYLDMSKNLRPADLLRVLEAIAHYNYEHMGRWDIVKCASKILKATGNVDTCVSFINLSTVFDHPDKGGSLLNSYLSFGHFALPTLISKKWSEIEIHKTALAVKRLSMACGHKTMTEFCRILPNMIKKYNLDSGSLMTIINDVETLTRMIKFLTDGASFPVDAEYAELDMIAILNDTVNNKFVYKKGNDTKYYDVFQSLSLLKSMIMGSYYLSFTELRQLMKEGYVPEGIESELDVLLIA